MSHDCARNSPSKSLKRLAHLLPSIRKMSRRPHSIHDVVEQEFGEYSTSDVGRGPPTPAITGRLHEAGDRAEGCYQICMVEVALEDPAIQKLERVDEERVEQELLRRMTICINLQEGRELSLSFVGDRRGFVKTKRYG